MRTRKAILPDAKNIHELIAAYSGDGTLLPRTLAEICENVRDFDIKRQLVDSLRDPADNLDRRFHERRWRPVRPINYSPLAFLMKPFVLQARHACH